MNTGFHSQKIFRGKTGGRRPILAKNLKLKMMNERRQKASFEIAKPTRRSPSRPLEAAIPNQKVCPFLCSLNAGCKRANKQIPLAVFGCYSGVIAADIHTLFGHSCVHKKQALIPIPKSAKVNNSHAEGSSNGVFRWRSLTKSGSILNL